MFTTSTMENEKGRRQKPLRLKDKNFLIKRNTPGAFTEEDKEIRKILESSKVDPWDLLREG